MNPEITITVEDESDTSPSRSYTVHFFDTHIFVTVTKTPSVVRKWIATTVYLRNRRRLFGQLVIGVAVQWNPYRGNDPPAHTLQLCVGCRCLIFQLSHATTVPLILRRFLLDETNTFVGIWNGSDQKKLEMEHGLDIHRLLDLRRYVETDEGDSLLTASVEAIVSECLGFEGVYLDQAISMSRWDAHHLSWEQVLQATVKAYVAFEIGKNQGAWRY
ncbi:unnamed protein product [Cuscuta epithymum]|uniref:3'-5' exonuclease domain-containing protein n=1 Tax=Cuscuta epithymum TaxID=186058 RepID=A0AAV0FES2_9ASTE|nr:unnamed protein product [Cuscuta epithymum]